MLESFNLTRCIIFPSPPQHARYLESSHQWTWSCRPFPRVTPSWTETSITLIIFSSSDPHPVVAKLCGVNTLFWYHHAFALPRPIIRIVFVFHSHRSWLFNS